MASFGMPAPPTIPTGASMPTKTVGRYAPPPLWAVLNRLPSQSPHSLPKGRKGLIKQKGPAAEATEPYLTYSSRRGTVTPPVTEFEIADSRFQIDGPKAKGTHTMCAPWFLLSTVKCGLSTQLNPGDDRLSHKVPLAVPWALEGLTTVFGMGTGVTPPVRSPENSQKQWLVASA